MQWSFPRVQLQIPPAMEKSCVGKTDPVTSTMADTHWPGHGVLTRGWKKDKAWLYSWWLFVQLFPVKVVVTNVSSSNLRTDIFSRDQGNVILPLTLWSRSGATELQPHSREYANVSLLNLNVLRKTDLANWYVHLYLLCEYKRVYLM